MRSDVGPERREVTCLRESLSEQDFESVGGASGREGLRRMRPRWEKWARPRRGRGVVGASRGDGDGEGKGKSRRGRGQGEGSSWAAMVSSMLASPPGRVG